jgi:hypothetical protein
MKKITDKFLHGTMREIVGLGHRVSGSDAERAAAEYIMRHFKKAGLSDVAYEPFSIRYYEPGTTVLSARLGGESWTIPAHPMWYTAGGAVKGGAVSLGLGAPRDFSDRDIRGRIAVVESRVLLNYYPTHSLLGTYHQAAAKGAAAYIACIDAPLDLAPRYNHLHEDEPPGPIPGIILTRSDGKFLMDLLGREGLELEISMTSSEKQAGTGDVIGFLPGTEEYIFIGSHYDSVYDGAVDNAAANAGLIALAYAFAGRKGKRPTLCFAAHPGHEINIGAREFVKRHEDIIRRAYLYLSLDGFGSSGYIWGPHGVTATGADEKRGISASGNPVLLAAAVDAVKKYNLLPAAYVPASDIIFNKDLEGRFYQAGVPTLMIIGKPIWYHTVHDTPDKVTPDQLRRSFLAHEKILRTMIKTPAGTVRGSDRRARDQVTAGVIKRPVKEGGLLDGRSVSFGCIPEPATAGEPVLCFINDFTNPSEVIVEVQWDFGDGAVGHGPVLAHVYARPGRYTLAVSVTDTSGCRTTVSQGLWVAKSK